MPTLSRGIYKNYFNVVGIWIEPIVIGTLFLWSKFNFSNSKIATIERVTRSTISLFLIFFLCAKLGYSIGCGPALSAVIVVAPATLEASKNEVLSVIVDGKVSAGFSTRAREIAIKPENLNNPAFISWLEGQHSEARGKYNAALDSDNFDDLGRLQGHTQYFRELLEYAKGIGH